MSIFVYLFLFTFAYLPQLAVLLLYQGGLAFVNTAFLVLTEGSAIIALLFEAFFVDETLAEIVDSVSYLLVLFFLLVNIAIIMNRSLSTKATQTSSPPVDSSTTTHPHHLLSSANPPSQPLIHRSHSASPSNLYYSFR